MADQLTWNPVTVDLNQQYEILGSGIDTEDRGFIPIDEIVAENVAETVKLDFAPELQNNIFNELKTGEWQGFDLMPEFKDLPTSERALSNDDIIRLFAKSPEGKIFEEGSFTKGFARDILPQTGGAAAFVGGAKTGAKILSKTKMPVPPIVKFLVPTLTGLGSSIAAYKGGEELTSLMMGDENPILPGTRNAYAKGKTAAGVPPWAILPFTVSKNVNFNAAQYLDNLAYLNLSNVGAKEVAPKNIRILAGVEKLLTGVGETARKRPIPFALVEGVAGTSQTILGGQAEEDFPQQALPRLGYEAGGSLIPGVLGSILIERTSTIVSALSNTLKNLKTEGLRGLNFVRKKREAQGVQRILEIIEAEGENVDEIVKKLSDPKLLVDENGRPIEMTAGLKSGSPVLMAIEASLAQTSRGLGKQQKTAVTQAGTALRNLITALAASGDKDSLKEAAKLSEALFSAALADRLKTRSANVLSAFEKLKGDDPRTNAQLGELLYDTVSDLLTNYRNQEKTLWRNVTSQELTTFNRPDGQTSTIPNFIEAWSKSMPQEEVAKKYYLQTGRLNPLNEFVEKISLSLGIKQRPVQSSSKILNLQAQKKDMETPGLLASYRKLQNEIDDPDKTRLYNLGDKYVYDESLSLDDNIIGLAEQLAKKETGKFGSATRRAEYNNVIKYAKKNRQINSLISQEQKDLVQDLTKERVPVSVNSLVEMRSLALNIGSAQLAVGDRNSARIAFDFADAILKDINSVPEGQDIAYDTARAFSKSLNDVFTRAFAGDILAKDKTRSTRLAPELLSSSLLRGGAEPTLLRIKQIGAVGKFAMDEGLPDAEGLSNTVSGTLEMMLRNARVAAIDPETGEVNTKLLKRWMDQNKEVLDQQIFQGLRDDLNDVNSANVLLGDTRVKNKKFKKKLDDQFYFSKLLPKLGGAESPTYAAGLAVRGKNPIRDINNLVKLAQASDDPKAAMNGLKSSILESALTHAGGTSQSFSVRALADSLFSNMPNARIKTNLTDYMVTKGIMTEPEAKTMKKFITELVKLEAADEMNKLGGLLEDGLNPMTDLYLRLVGSQLGASVGALIPGRSGAGQGIIESGAGVRAMMSIFRDVPQSMKMDVMGDLMTNPTKLADLLKTSKDEKIQLRIAEKVGRYLQQMGFKPIRRLTPAVVREVSPEGEDEATEVEERDEFINNIQQKINKNKVSSVEPSVQRGLPTTQVSSNQPFLSGLNTAPAGGGGSSATSAPTDRSKYASLFPTDIVSSMIQPTATMAEGGEVKYMAYGGDPSQDMGLETDVAAQESIQDSLGSGVDTNSRSTSNFQVRNVLDRIRSIPTSVKQNINYNAPSMFSGLPNLNVGGFNISLGPVGDTLGITATKTFAEGGAVPPREIDIKGQPHMLAYITPQEGGILQLLGGAGKPGPMGIPSFYDGDGGVSEGMDEADAAEAAANDMGMDDSVADMADAMAGHTAGLSGYSNVQGSINYAPVQNVPYDFLGLVKNAMNRHARSSLSKGYQPEFSVDPTTGNITSVTGKGGPGMSIPGIGSLMSMIGSKMGGITTTGYAGKGVDDRNNPNDNGNNDELIRKKIIEELKPLTSKQIYDINPEQYTLRYR